MKSVTHQLRIHGDNILECERALDLLAVSLSDGSFKLKLGPAYAPIYEFKPNDKEHFEVQLFPGYGRWNFPLADYIVSLGGMLREAPDAIVTEIEIRDRKKYEKLILALEFSGALPAGNNAWQRTGRALALAYAGIPYLYFAELGGQELDSSRFIKAARFPNPLVPFAYSVLGTTSGSISLPIYTPSPSSNKKVTEIFKSCFGTQEAVELVRRILLSKNTNQLKERIEKKVLGVVKILSQQRKREDVLTPKEWLELYSKKMGDQKAAWLTKKAMPWNKKTGIKTLTPSFKKLLKETSQSIAIAIGSKEIPICLVPKKRRRALSLKIQSIYEGKINNNFIGWLRNSSRPLICVWIAGFKPRGDDSRPDRGLVPLARMIFGIKGVDLLTIVYGPAKPATWKVLQNNMEKLAKTNGLWEAIINLSDGILIDSNTSKDLSQYGFLVKKQVRKVRSKLLSIASDKPNFGEHDVDAVLHLLFSNNSHDGKIYECMCNPPGGDWSGVNILEITEKIELRWTSLPRVSGKTSKRPDHLIQFLNSRTLLSIESKDAATRLEEKIGPKLVTYIKTLLNSIPIAVRKLGNDTWEQYDGEGIKKFELVPGGAFRYKNDGELKKTLIRARVDILFGIEFIPENKGTVIHICVNKKGNKLIPSIKRLTKGLKGMIKIRVL